MEIPRAEAKRRASDWTERGGAMHGVLVIDKDPGMTSHDVVAKARRGLGTKRIGHAGTLDPLASGVLVLLVGEATKLSQHLMASEKEYEATFLLGIETDSLDADGEVTGTQPVPPLDEALLQDCVKRLCGRMQQQVPMVSAVRVNGQRLHAVHRAERARQASKPDPAIDAKGPSTASQASMIAPTREVELHEAQLLRWGGHEVRVRLRTSHGFYVRSFCRDFAKLLGTVGHVTALRRTRSGVFEVGQSVPYVALKTLAARPLQRDLRRPRGAPARHDNAAAPSDIASSDTTSSDIVPSEKAPSGCTPPLEQNSPGQPLLEKPLLEEKVPKDPMPLLERMILSRMVPVSDAARCMVGVSVDEEAAHALSQGKRVSWLRDDAKAAPLDAGGAMLRAVFRRDGRLIAIAQLEGAALRVLRGFNVPPPCPALEITV